jgi:transposase-like protein
MKLMQVIATATTAAVLGTIGVSVAGATTSGGSSPTSASATANPNRAARRGVLAGLRKQALALAAKTIGVKPADLANELKAGKSVADVANEHNVQPQTVIDALVHAADNKIEAAKTAGKITPDQASKLEAKVPDTVTKLVNAKHPGANVNAKVRQELGKFRKEAGVLAAKTIGVTPAALKQEVKAGKSVADVATEHGVQPQTVIDALVQAGDKKIEAAKTAGKITAAQATNLENRLPTLVTKLVNAHHGS